MRLTYSIPIQGSILLPCFPKVLLLVLISLSLPSQLKWNQFTLTLGLLPCFNAQGSLRSQKWKSWSFWKLKNKTGKKKALGLQWERDSVTHTPFEFARTLCYCLVLPGFPTASSHSYTGVLFGVLRFKSHSSSLQDSVVYELVFLTEDTKLKPLFLTLSVQLTVPQTSGSVLFK